MASFKLKFLKSENACDCLGRREFKILSNFEYIHEFTEHQCWLHLNN